MRKYKVTYITVNDTISTVILEAMNMTHLAMVIVEKIHDMKDNNADNIIKTEFA